MSHLQTLQNELADWAMKNVPESDHLKKLQEEVKELVATPDDAGEMADVFMALLIHANSRGVDIAEAVAEKFAVIQQREYGKPDHNGVSRHIAPAQCKEAQ